VVVAIDDIHVKYTVLTLDDGSGATVEVKIVRLTPKEYSPVDCISNTRINNVNVISGFGVFEVLIDHRQVDIGSVLKVKGTLDEFRGMKQLEIKRVWMLSSTNEEAKAWSETAAFKLEVLSKPWRLTSAEHRKIVDEMEREKKALRRYERKKAAHEAKVKEIKKTQQEHLARRQARLDARQQKEEVLHNKGALI
jgi:hypothetical protein